MNVIHTTVPSESSIISDIELIEEFCEIDIRTYNTRGKEQFRTDAASLLEPQFDQIEIDYGLRADASPDWQLEMIECDLRGALENVTLLRRAWEDLKAERLIDEDSVVERYRAKPDEQGPA